MKKFLSLVLALVMTMSLVTVSAGAKDFTDDGEITYKEAVDVISGIGVVDGYSDGDFRPDDVLTRGAAAKIICNLILGPTTASALSAGTAPFKDVPVTNTFAGYITYCSQQGIINGYADGTFRPQGTLSGNAFMKMLLGALGYDGSNEKYTGPNWQVSVIKQASGIGLDDGNDEFLGSKAVTRQEAALYAFNMLQATMVEYDKKDTIVVGDITINSASTRKDVENTAKNETIEDDDKMQFAEKYFEKLVAEDDVDSFGRPSTTWKFDGDKLGTYANDADTTYVVADANKDLATLATDSDYLDYAEKDILKNADVYYNGDLVGEYSKVSDEVLAGKGDIVEAYENDDNEVSAIVIRSYTFAKIDSVDKDLSSSLTNKGASVGIDLVDVKGNDVANGTYYDNHDDDDKVLNGYTSDYTEGTALAVAVSAEDDATILDSYIIDSVSGKPSAAREVKVENKMVTEGTITLDGTKYDYAAQMTGIDNGENVDFDEEYEVFLTAEGYVLAVDGASYATLKDVYYVAGVYGETSRGKTTYYAQAISVTDGTEHQLKLDVDKDKNAGDLTGLTKKFENKDAGLYIMDEDDGKYTAEKYIGQDSYSVVVDTLDQDVTNSSSTIRFKGSSNNANNDGKKDTISRLYLDETTFFVGVEDDSEDISISTATGVMSVEKASKGLKVYAIYKDGEDDAVFVVYAAKELNGAVNKDDVVYLTDDAKTSVKDGYIVDLYFMKDLSLSEDVTIDDAGQTTQGFYVFTVDGEVYKLKTDSSNMLSGEVTDNSDGYGKGIVFDSVKNTNVSSDGDQFVGVSFKDATVIDTRSSSEKKADIYSNDIESTSRLTSAIEKGEVTADVYVEDGEIIFVAVIACENAAETPEKPDVDAKEFSSVVDTKVKGYEDLSLKNAEVSRSGVLTLPALEGENIAVQIEDAMAYLGYTDVNLKKSGSVYTITATKDKIEEEITCDLDTNVTYYVEITLDGTTQYVAASTKVADLVGVKKATYVMIDDTATEVSGLSNKTVEDGSVYVTGYYKVTAPADVSASGNAGAYTATVAKEYAKEGETVTVTVTTKTAATSGTDTITLTGVSGGNAAVGQEAAALNESLTFTYEMDAANSRATINVVNA